MIEPAWFQLKRYTIKKGAPKSRSEARLLKHRRKHGMNCLRSRFRLGLKEYPSILRGSLLWRVVMNIKRVGGSSVVLCSI